MGIDDKMIEEIMQLPLTEFLKRVQALGISEEEQIRIIKLAEEKHKNENE